MKKKKFINGLSHGLSLMLVMVVIMALSWSGKEQPGFSERPNVILIYLDDLGYGDVGAYGATEPHTPSIDMLAAGGLRFTNGYAASATCTPSRYALLTGTYPWRNRSARILPGTAPLIIDTAGMTLPKMFRNMGYHTGIVGKWHLGLGSGKVDWNGHIAPGPNEVGFDESFIMAATQDRVPTVYIENGQVVRLDPEDPIRISYTENFPGEPTGLDHPELLKMKWEHGHNQSIVNGIPRIGYMTGGETARWVDENMADTFLTRAQQFIMAHREEPFFLYYAMQQPHVPRTPHPRFAGSTSLGPRGDVIVEADWCIGQLMNTLMQAGMLESTLVILSSDNGPVLNDGYFDDAVEKNGSHTPAGPFRGGKYSLFEGGTRVPFIAFWKGRIGPGVSDAVISQVDLLSSLASLLGSEARGPDSEDLSRVLMGESDRGREVLVLEATGRTALRKGKWKLIPPYPGPAIMENVQIESGNSKLPQLYDLAHDQGEQVNLAPSEAEKLEEMITTHSTLRGE
ncbi:MAG: sulfatase-like hydrolase/transferase [Bacteroidales bacterium]